MTPGAPNRPPEAAAAPAPPPAPDPPQVRLLRRLVPSHVALLLDLWKGGVPPEVTGPYEKAEAAYHAGDYPTATSALDLLSIRFAEPRWPTLIEPFQKLRVPIIAPVPPHWDPEHALSAPEKEARQGRRLADTQLALAEACVAWASSHGLAADGDAGTVAAAKAALGDGATLAEFYTAVDGLWRALDGRLPPPQRSGTPVAAPAPAAPADDA